MPQGQYLDGDSYGLLHFSLDGITHFDAIGYGNPGAIPEIPGGEEPPMLMPVQLRDGRIVHIDTHDPGTWPREVRRRGVSGYRAYQRRSAGMGALELGVQTLQGINYVSNMDNDRVHRYQIRFEVNDDGRRRAMITVANVFHGPNLATGEEQIQLNTYAVRAGADGVELKPVTYKEWEWDKPPTISAPSGPVYSLEDVEEADPLPVVRPQYDEPSWFSKDD